MSDRLLLARAFFEMLERLLLRFLLPDDCLTFRVTPFFAFAADRCGPGFRSPTPPPGRRATPLGKFVFTVSMAALLATLVNSLRLGFFLPDKICPISGTALSIKFLPTCFATGKTYFLTSGMATRPIRTVKAQCHPQIPSVWLVH